MIDKKDIPALCRKRVQVIHNNAEYTLCGYQVLHKSNEVINSVVLEDERGCLLWVNYETIELKAAKV